MNPFKFLKRKKTVAPIAYNRATDSPVTTALIEARNRIADPKHWCQKSFAQDQQGESVSMFSDSYDQAAKYCAVGTLYVGREDRAVAFIYRDTAQEYLWQAASDMTGKSGISRVNDELDHDAVMEMYDRAIELSRQ